MIDGELREIDEKTSCLVEETFDANISAQGKENNKEGTDADSKVVAKKIASREQLISKMKEYSSRTGARKLLYSVLLSATLLIAIVVLEYTLTMQSRSDANSRINLINETYSILENLYQFMYVERQMVLAEDNITIYPYATEAALITGTFSEMYSIVDSINAIEKIFYLDPTLYNAQDFQIYYPYILGNNTIGYNYDYDEALNLVFIKLDYLLANWRFAEH